MDVQEQIIACIARADPNAALELIREWGREHGFGRLAEQVLLPVLERFTEEYAAEDQSPLARGYVAACVAEETMNLILAETPGQIAEQAPSKGMIVLGNAEDDFHALGRRIVGTFLRADGWQVIDLGNDVPAAEFVDKALRAHSRVIGVSAMMYTTAMNIRQVRAELDKRGLSGKIKLAVGGAVFTLRPELLQEVGGDGTTRTAMQAPTLIGKLWQAAEQDQAHE